MVGAGIAGLSAALLLRQKGVEVEIIDSSHEIGGLLAPVIHDDLELDRGSHRVHPEAHPLLLELTQEANWKPRPRSGTLILGGKKLSYPLNPLRFVSGLGPRTSIDMGLGWLRRPNTLRRALTWERDRHQVVDDQGFEHFVVRRVGKAAYDRFYQPYAQKVWGIDPCELSQTIAKQRVSTSNPLSSIIRRSAQHFLYPEKGMAELIELLHSKLKRAGAKFTLGRRYDADARDSGPVFYTGHLNHIVPTAKLTHRGLYLIHLTVSQDLLDDTDTWYTPESDYWFGRVSQPAAFSKSLCRPSERVICVEIPEGRWGKEQNFVERSDELMRQLNESGILRKKVTPISIQQNFLPRVYPMYVRNWVREHKKTLEKVAQRGEIFPCGRQGLFLHCNMDHAVETAAAAVDHWTSGGTSESWVVQCQEFSNFRVRD